MPLAQSGCVYRSQFDVTVATPRNSSSGQDDTLLQSKALVYPPQKKQASNLILIHKSDCCENHLQRAAGQLMKRVYNCDRK